MRKVSVALIASYKPHIATGKDSMPAHYTVCLRKRNRRKKTAACDEYLFNKAFFEEACSN